MGSFALLKRSSAHSSSQSFEFLDCALLVPNICAKERIDIQLEEKETKQQQQQLKLESELEVKRKKEVVVGRSICLRTPLIEKIRSCFILFTA